MPTHRAILSLAKDNPENAVLAVQRGACNGVYVAVKNHRTSRHLPYMLHTLTHVAPTATENNGVLAMCIDAVVDLIRKPPPREICSFKDLRSTYDELGAKIWV